MQTGAGPDGHNYHNMHCEPVQALMRAAASASYVAMTSSALTACTH